MQSAGGLGLHPEVNVNDAVRHRVLLGLIDFGGIGLAIKGHLNHWADALGAV